MTPSHERWDEFCERLEGPEGCDFRERVPGDSTTVTWECAGRHNKRLSRKVLRAMGFDKATIDESCEYFDSHGGHCDCEILFNVERGAIYA